MYRDLGNLTIILLLPILYGHVVLKKIQTNSKGLSGGANSTNDLRRAGKMKSIFK